MTITVHAQLGPEESGELLYEGSLDTPVTFGRAPDNTHVLVSPSVGSYHLALTKRDGRVVLEIVDRQPVYAVGPTEHPPRLTGQHVLFGDGSRRIELDLGYPIRGVTDTKGALRLVIQDRGSGRPPRHPDRSAREREDRRSTRRERNRNLVVLLFTIVGSVTLLGCGTGFGFVYLSAGQEALQQRLDEAEEQAEKRGERIESLVERNLAVVREAVTADFVSPPARVEGAADSVWLAGVVDRLGTFEGLGTAWILTDGSRNRIVTNAHVLEALMERSSGRAVIRLGDREVALAPLDQALVHPGYRTLQDYRLDEGRRHWTNPYDVALLDPADVGADLSPALFVAPTPTLEGLDVDEDVHSFGYPSENIAQSQPHLDQPAPLFDRGYIAQVADATRLSYAAPARRHVLVVKLPAIGGASGSPVLSRDGEVVGMLYGSDKIGVDERSVRTSGGQRYDRYRINVGYGRALRADVILSMLDGRSPLDLAWLADESLKVGTAAEHLSRTRAVRLKQLQEDGRCLGEIAEVVTVPIRPRDAAGYEGTAELPAGHWLATFRVPDEQGLGLVEATVVPPGAGTRRSVSADADGFALVDFTVTERGDATFLADGDPGLALTITAERCSPAGGP